MALNFVKDVKVINYLFAFTEEGVKYTVSDYEEMLNCTLRSVMDKLKVEKNYVEYARLQNRANAVNDILSDYYDLTTFNMSYNKETDEIILFDLNRIKDSWVESPDEEL